MDNHHCTSEGRTVYRSESKKEKVEFFYAMWTKSVNLALRCMAFSKSWSVTKVL